MPYEPTVTLTGERAELIPVSYRKTLYCEGIATDL